MGTSDHELKIISVLFYFASIVNENCQLCFVIILINPKGIHQQPNIKKSYFSFPLSRSCINLHIIFITLLWFPIATSYILPRDY